MKDHAMVVFDPHHPKVTNTVLELEESSTHEPTN